MAFPVGHSTPSRFHILAWGEGGQPIKGALGTPPTEGSLGPNQSQLWFPESSKLLQWTRHTEAEEQQALTYPGGHNEGSLSHRAHDHNPFLPQVCGHIN